MQNIPKNLIFSIILILVCVSRLIPHPYNFSPIGSIFLMSPIIFSNKKWALFISIIPLFISDILIGKLIYNSKDIIYEGFIWVYFSYFLIWLYSTLNNQSQNVLVKSVIGSLIFFFVTNAACWYGNTMYQQNIFGLIESFVFGIPFYWNTVAGFVFYSLLINFIVNYIDRKIYDTKIA